MQPLQLTVGGTVRQMIESDLALELGAVKQYNAAVQRSRLRRKTTAAAICWSSCSKTRGSCGLARGASSPDQKVGYERYLSLQTGSFEDKS